MPPGASDVVFDEVRSLVQKRSSRQSRWSGLQLLRLWQWLFNVSLTAVFVLLFINWPQLLLRLRLAEDKSIFQHGWLVLLVMSLLLLLTALVHELGHLLAGWLVHFRFQVLVIGPIRISGENGRLRAQFQRGGSLFNGLAASVPYEMDNLPRRLLYYALGGPLASLLLSIGCFALALFLGSNLSRMLDYLWLWECLLFTAVISYFFLLTSLRPGMYHNGLIADGGRILMITAKSSQADRWQALVMLHAADFMGERPSQWDKALLQQALTKSDNSHDYLIALVMNYHHSLDVGAPQKASDYLEEALNLPVTWETGMRARLMLEKAYLAAACFRDHTMARESLWQVKSDRRRVNLLYLRAKSALHVLEGDMALAQETAVPVLQQPTENQTGLQRAEIDWLNKLLVRDSEP